MTSWAALIRQTPFVFLSPTSSVYLYRLTYFLLLSSFSSFGTTGGYIVTFIMKKMKKLE
jgi:hypothetical protein